MMTSGGIVSTGNVSMNPNRTKPSGSGPAYVTGVQMGGKAESFANQTSTGSAINASRNSASVASIAQALANQTGGNIMGFTYE